VTLTYLIVAQETPRVKIAFFICDLSFCHELTKDNEKVNVMEICEFGIT